MWNYKYKNREKKICFTFFFLKQIDSTKILAAVLIN